MAAMKDAYNRLLSTISRFRRKKSSNSESEDLDIKTIKEPATKTTTVVEVNNNNKERISITVTEPSNEPPTAGVLYRKPTLRSKLSVPRPRSATFIHLVQSTFYTRSNSYEDGDEPAAVKLYNKNERLRKLKKVKSRRRVMSEIRLSERRLMPIEAFSSRLNDYNTYYQGRPEELRQRQNRKGELVIDGLLNIYWGLRSSIRLQVADDVKIRPRIEEIKEFESKQSESPKKNVATPAQMEEASTLLPPTPITTPAVISNESSKVATAGVGGNDGFRARSVVMRRKVGTRASYRRRASINGHYYNQETSIFTPTHGSVTKVRVLSTNNAHDVITKLFQKFRVENSADCFSLYVVKETEELREMPHDEYPLISRVLVGPNEQLGKIFIMEKKMHKEISPEVAQFIKLDPNILRVFLSKFAEEEEREILKMKKRFDFYRKMIKKYMREAKHVEE